MSSWLDNIAAHCEEEDEEDYESQPQLKASASKPQQQVQSQEQQDQPQKSESQNSQQVPQDPQQSQQNQQQLELPKSQEEKINPELINKDQKEPEKEPPKDKQTDNDIYKHDEPTKKSPYTNTITKEIYKLDKSINFLLKRQEFYYAGSMIKTRSSVDSALERTSKPIQTIGGLGTISLEAKGKYDVLKKRIMNIQPLCSVAPKAK